MVRSIGRTLPGRRSGARRDKKLVQPTIVASYYTNCLRPGYHAILVVHERLPEYCSSYSEPDNPFCLCTSSQPVANTALILSRARGR